MVIKRTISLLFLILLINNCNCNKPTGKHILPQNKDVNDSFNKASEAIVFLGNPGVGKSTLCNSIFGKAVFNSGLSIGTGMTTHKQEYIYENKLYIDTPGLHDVKNREQAAIEIEKALKRNKKYKIVFVTTLEEGRIKADDLVTINEIGRAIKTNFQYGLIFNKVFDEEIEEINKVAPIENNLYKCLKLLPKEPYSTIILTRDKRIKRKCNMHFQSGDENRKKLLEFLDKLPAFRIEETEVERIDVRDHDEKVKEMQEMYKKIIDELNKKAQE